MKHGEGDFFGGNRPVPVPVVGLVELLTVVVAASVVVVVVVVVLP